MHAGPTLLKNMFHVYQTEKPKKYAPHCKNLGSFHLKASLKILSKSIELEHTTVLLVGDSRAISPAHVAKT